MSATAGLRAEPAARVELVRPGPRASGPDPAAGPGLDPEQLAVRDHPQGGGPLVLLGGPGTGKTTALIAALVARVERDGVPPDGLLLLAATRQAAVGLRDRLSALLGRTVREPLARTLHSYAFGLLRRQLVLAGDAPPRLISGAEQDRILAELLAGHEAGAGRAPAWPQSVPAEIRALRGFRDELRDLLMRAVERGLGPAGLAALGRRHDRPEWVAAAHLLDEYLDVTSLATPGAYDPAGLLDAAAGLLVEDPELLREERSRWQVIALDDGQELTAAGQRLLALLAGNGHDLLLAGDPDASTQGFRGARPHLVARAPDAFARPDGSPAPTVLLRTVHRHGPALRAVAVAVASRIGSAGTTRHRAGTAAGQPGGPGEADVRLLASAAQEAAFVAQELRRQHLERGVPWARMAVIARSARATHALRRALGAAGVPVTVPGAEIPVRDEPAVVPLRLALRCALDPQALTPELAAELLSGPFGGVDTVGQRRLRQALRVEELAAGGGRGSDALLVEALAATGRLATLDPRVSRGARRIAALLAAGREAVADPAASAETVLWALWQAAGVGEAWRRQALGSGPSGARADRDLDAVVALFEASARYTDRLPQAGPAGFLSYLEGQDLPADTLAERAPEGEAVALVTPHGAAGREWDVVAVTGVQEGSWPDLRLRSSLLGGQALSDLLDGRTGPGGGTVAAQRRAVLDDELRLFHVAVSRARQALVVTAVRSEEELPSPFLDLVRPLPDGQELRTVSAVPRAMTLPALVAELRATVVDPAQPDSRRAVAATRLARLASAGVPGADPQDWYGLAELSSPGALRGPDQQVRVSPSRVEQFGRCALRWLLDSAGGTAGNSSAQAFGTLVHELAEQAPGGTRQELRRLLAERIVRLGLGEGWVADRDRARLEAMVDKLAEYIASAERSGRRLVAVEQQVEVLLGRAVLRGTLDRVERDPQGRLLVVDLKTGRTPPTAVEVTRNAQLGAYQVAVVEGGVPAVGPEPAVGSELSGPELSAGAALVQLGSKNKHMTVQRQPPLDADEQDPGWAHALVRTAADGMAGETFPATGGAHCRFCPARRCCPLQSEGRQVGE